jgi:hypothetical protein
MYYSFLRGKKYELLAIRDSSDKINQSNISIILEPVNDNFKDITTALHTVNTCNFIFIINPKVGNLVNNTNILIQRTRMLIEANPSLIIGLNVDSGCEFSQIQYWLNEFSQSKFVLIHLGKMLFAPEFINQQERIIKHVFLSRSVSDWYISQFSKDKILLEDSFNRLSRNYDYQDKRIEFFSDTHLTFRNNGFQGFGNFSTVGNHYTNSKGGRAHTLAFHLTFNDMTKNNIISIEHCLSDPRTHQEDISLLREELLQNIHSVIQNNPTLLNWSSACQKLESMYQDNTFSYSLGDLKRLSIRHHFELMHLLKSNRIY